MRIMLFSRDTWLTKSIRYSRWRAGRRVSFLSAEGKLNVPGGASARYIALTLVHNCSTSYDVIVTMFICAIAAAMMAVFGDGRSGDIG